jgi:hypothetical protein
LTSQDQSQIRASLTNTLNALLNHVTLFFSNPPPKELPAHLLSPNPHSAPSTPLNETPGHSQGGNHVEWSFLPPNSSALAAAKWGLMLLETLGKRLQDFLPWGEETADGIRIAVGGIRERIARATLIAWRDGISLGNRINSDAEHFYVLEDWVIDKVRGNGVTGWVGGCHGYQRQVIQGLEHIVKYIQINSS